MELSVMLNAAQKAFKDAAKGGTISGSEKAVDANNKITYETSTENHPVELGLGSGFFWVLLKI
jgi:hypothetical protein